MRNGHEVVAMGEKEYRWLEKGLKSLGFFRKLDLKVLSGVIPYISLIKYPKGRAVCREGEPGDGFFLVYQGTVKVEKKGWDGPIARLKSGAFFGEMSLLFGQPRNATVRAVGLAKLFMVESKDFMRMLKKNPSVARTIRRIAEERRRGVARE